MPIFSFPPIQPKTIKTVLPEECLAKTRWSYASETGFRLQKGCDLQTHLWTTYAILHLLKKKWAGYPREKQISHVALYLSLFHDIGKATPAFLGKLYKALEMPLPWDRELVEDKGGHARNSEIILTEKFGQIFGQMAGCHHGGACWPKGFAGSPAKEELGGPAWEQLRNGIIAHLQKKLQLPTLSKQTIKNYDPISVGACILADWISSGMNLPYGEDLPSEEMLETALTNAGMLPPKWQNGLSFDELFGFSPNKLQQACVELAVPGGTYVIESGMGSGKTEAALYLAYQLLAAHKANGLYFALPTRLTSEKINDRLNRFLQKALAQGEEQNTSLLIHGEAWLEWILEQPQEDENLPHRKGSWFQTKKRALLAPFASGTIDQALLSIINVKHRDLRAFALAGKVVILDEVHSYDAFTGTLVASLVHRLREWGATTIILSATLTAAARNRLLGVASSAEDMSHSYPLVSLSNEKSEVRHIEFSPGESAAVVLQKTSDTAEALRSALSHAQRKEQVLWIVNTVSDAQMIFRKLSAYASGIELGLIHSRFPACERRQREGYWVAQLGKDGGMTRYAHGRILVATQVLEQSVDVDADYLITQTAPTDMLFQRMGRLWRHEKLDSLRPQGTIRACLIVFPEDADKASIWKENGAAALPYDSYWMYRSAQVMLKREHVSLPDDIRPLLEETYEEHPEKEEAAFLMKQMQDKKRKLERMANLSQGELGAPESDDEDALGTRYSDCESVQVLLLKKSNAGLPLNKQIASFFASTPIDIPPRKSSYAIKAQTAAALMAVMVAVPVSSAPRYEDFPLEFLAHILWIGDGKDRPVRAAFVNEDGTLLTQSSLPVDNKRELTYRAKLGYCARKRDN